MNLTQVFNIVFCVVLSFIFIKASKFGNMGYLSQLIYFCSKLMHSITLILIVFKKSYRIFEFCKFLLTLIFDSLLTGFIGFLKILFFV